MDVLGKWNPSLLLLLVSQACVFSQEIFSQQSCSGIRPSQLGCPLPGEPDPTSAFTTAQRPHGHEPLWWCGFGMGNPMGSRVIQLLCVLTHVPCSFPCLVRSSCLWWWPENNTSCKAELLSIMQTVL